MHGLIVPSKVGMKEGQADAPSLAIFKVMLERALSNLILVEDIHKRV